MGIPHVIIPLKTDIETPKLIPFRIIRPDLKWHDLTMRIWGRWRCPQIRVKSEK